MRRASLFSLVVIAASAALVACGGGGDEDVEIGQLTNPQDVPTAAPWDQPPEVIILDPNAITPIGAGQPTPEPTAAAAGVCGPKYTIVSGDTFSSIAEKCGTTTQGMRDANPGVDPLTIRAGQVVNVPAPEPSP
jgi:hypothetical protein